MCDLPQPNTRKAAIEILQALEQGKEVECFSLGHGAWFPTKSEIPSFDRYVYRIKPSEPFRLNTLEEQVELLKAKLEGKTLVFRDNRYDYWTENTQRVPAFDEFQYRIAKKGE